MFEIGRYFNFKIVWWKVDFGEMFGIYSVIILFRIYCYDNLGMLLFNLI